MKIVWNNKEFARTLKAQDTLKMVDAEARKIANRANSSSSGKYEPSSMVGKNRARASVITADAKAIRENARNNTLLRSL